MPSTPKILEVIVTSIEEAIEAEAGGADRLELVRALELGGLTPEFELVREILATVSIPVRVMVRDNSSMSIAGQSELAKLAADARAFSRLRIHGLVLGWVQNRQVDIVALQTVLAAAGCRATYHRAIEHVRDALAAIRTLKQFPQIDRILTSGGPGPWPERKQRLLEWQRAASPEITILVRAGISQSALAGVLEEPELLEFHVGRAARIPHHNSGAVSRLQVAQLKSVLPRQ